MKLVFFNEEFPAEARTPDELATIKDSGVNDTRSSCTSQKVKHASASAIRGFEVGETRESAVSTLDLLEQGNERRIL